MMVPVSSNLDTRASQNLQIVSYSTEHHLLWQEVGFVRYRKPLRSADPLILRSGQTGGVPPRVESSSSLVARRSRCYRPRSVGMLIRPRTQRSEAWSVARMTARSGESDTPADPARAVTSRPVIACTDTST